MTDRGSRARSTAATACSLSTGAPECRCLRDAPYLSDGQLITRATEMFRWQQRAAGDRRAAGRLGLDRLLEHARSRGTCAPVAELLRIAVLVRVFDTQRVDAGDVANLIAEFAELADRDGDARLLGEAATLRAHGTTVFGRGDDALADAAAALAILTDVADSPSADSPSADSPSADSPSADSPSADSPSAGDPDGRGRLLSRSLNDLVLVLLKLGAYEVADEVSQRGIAAAEGGCSAMDRLVLQLNRVRLQVAWALRLERGGREAAAAARFVGAARTAQVAATLWAPAHGGDPTTPAHECSIIGSAYALRQPGPEHLDMLDALAHRVRFTDDRIVLAIATARCLMVGRRPAAAVAVLAPLRDELGDSSSDAVLTLALHREFAYAHSAARAEPARPDDAVARYAAALEAELWALREARLTALRSHSEHHRLAREHGFVAAQAMQDPLTELPNRRALDLRLTEAVASSAGQPCAVALIDLDRFKDVNDARSHAAGDVVLREVAGCLRTALRAQDLVARYGGDEFVVVMPTTPLTVARAALTRAAEAVAALPVDRGGGVTLSIGVISAPLDGEPAAALAAADAAMYRAKHAGGNGVMAGTAPPGPEAGSWSDRVPVEPNVRMA